MAEHIIPWLSTPRILVFFNFSPVPGTVVPVRANTPLRPFLALAAPHTTWTCSVPVSTVQT